MFGLSFLSPLFLAGVAAAAIPIAIHLFHRRAEPVVEFSAMRFLRRAPVEHAHRRRVRELILLALRVSALALLALAFARPYLAESAAALAAPSTIVLVDSSVSMTAPGQFERAKTRAAAAVRDAAAGSRVGVITFANGADVVAPLGDDRAGALTAIGQLQPGAGATRYRAALTRAAGLLGGAPGRLVVVTDLQQSGWDALDDGAVPPGVAVEVADVGAPGANLAVTSLRVEGRDAFASVQNFSERQTTTQVSFAIDGRAVGAAAVTVGPAGSGDAHVTLPAGGSGALTASVVDAEGYAADNVRYALLDDAAAPLILAVTASGHPSESFYLQRAVAVAQGTDGFRFRAVGGPAFSGMTPDELGDVQVIAMLGTRGLEQRGRELLANYVNSGGGLLLTAGPDVDPAIVGQALQAVVGTSWSPGASSRADVLRFAPEDSRHPVFRVFGGVGTLSNVSFTEVANVKAGANAIVVARFTDGRPAVIEEAAGEGRVLLFASDLNNAWNDFPLQPAFVPFLHETFKHLASARPRPRDYLVGELAAAAGRTPGVAAVNGRRIVVNTDPRESDPARTTAETFTANLTELTGRAANRDDLVAQQREDGQRLW
jgi:hypothetical protein